LIEDDVLFHIFYNIIWLIIHSGAYVFLL